MAVVPAHRLPYDEEEYDDDSHVISKTIRTFGSHLYGNDAFQRAAAAIMAGAKGVSLDIEKLYASGINEMPAEEREQALGDLHGISQDVEETPEFLRVCLASMEQHLRSILFLERAEAYRLSLEIDATYSSDVNFRLMFLRSVQFHPVHAAERMVVHFALKLELFGKERLVRDITIYDIGPEALAALNTGYLQPMSARDNSGRLVMIYKTLAFSRTPLLITIWLVLMNAIRHDVMTQRKGMIMVGYNVGPLRCVDHRVWRDIAFCARAIPVRLAARHSLEDMSENIVFTLNRYFMRPAFRIRFRQYHEITLDDYHRELRRYGIPMEIFGLRGTAEERLVSQIHRVFVSQAIARLSNNGNMLLPNENNPYKAVDPLPFENENEAEAAVIAPPQAATQQLQTRIHDLRPNDVIFGRGNSRTHTGNTQVGILVKEFSSQYLSASKEQKTRIADRIVKRVRASGGRFLKLAEDELDMEDDDVGGFVEVSPIVARQKIGRHLRRFQDKRMELHHH